MTSETEKPLRDSTLSLRLRADVRARLDFVAERLGVAPSTLASVAVGQYAAAQQASLMASERQTDAVAQALANSLPEIFKSMDTAAPVTLADGKRSAAAGGGGGEVPSNLDTYK